MTRKKRGPTDLGYDGQLTDFNYAISSLLKDNGGYESVKKFISKDVKSPYMKTVVERLRVLIMNFEKKESL